MKWLRRIGAVVRKEWWHILRDRQTVAIIVIMPVAMMFLYGYALTLDLRNVRIAIENPSMSVFGTYLARRIDATTMYKTETIVNAISNPQKHMIRTQVKAIIRLPTDIERDVRDGGSPASVAVLIDGADQNTGTLIRNSIDMVIQDAILDYIGKEMPAPVTINTQILYNPHQKSSFYFVPGLMAIILIMVSALLTSLTITREKESGTIEQLLVSPLRPFEILIGKITPYVALAAADGVLILLTGRLAFGVRIHGSVLLLAFASVIYIMTSLALGLIFSTAARNQQQAMLMALPATLLPTIVLSGFIFPIRSMPWPLQIFAHCIPATYYLQVIRGIILKGVGPTALWLPLTVLMGAGALFLVLSIRLFRIKL